jgi:hypothetical protein
MTNTEFDRASRVRRARALVAESNDDLRARLLQGTPGATRREAATAAGAATSTLAGLGFGGHQTERDAVRDAVEALGHHLTNALEASIDGRHADVRRHVRRAKVAHKSLAELLGKGE